MFARILMAGSTGSGAQANGGHCILQAHYYAKAKPEEQPLLGPE